MLLPTDSANSVGIASSRVRSGCHLKVGQSPWWTEVRSWCMCWSCASASAIVRPLHKWIRSRLKLSSLLELRKGHCNREDTALRIRRTVEKSTGPLNGWCRESCLESGREGNDQLRTFTLISPSASVLGLI